MVDKVLIKRMNRFYAYLGEDIYVQSNIGSMGKLYQYRRLEIAISVEER